MNHKGVIIKKEIQSIGIIQNRVLTEENQEIVTDMRMKGEEMILTTRNILEKELKNAAAKPVQAVHKDLFKKMSPHKDMMIFT